jgi:hypothetical protein
MVYTTAGALAVAVGQGLQAVAIPTVMVARKVLGPLMILIGIAMLGVWTPRLAVGYRLADDLRQLRSYPGPRGRLVALDRVFVCLLPNTGPSCSSGMSFPRVSRARGSRVP